MPATVSCAASVAGRTSPAERCCHQAGDADDIRQTTRQRQRSRREAGEQRECRDDVARAHRISLPAVQGEAGDDPEGKNEHDEEAMPLQPGARRRQHGLEREARGSSEHGDGGEGHEQAERVSLDRHGQSDHRGRRDERTEPALEGGSGEEQPGADDEDRVHGIRSILDRHRREVGCADPEHPAERAPQPAAGHARGGDAQRNRAEQVPECPEAAEDDARAIEVEQPLVRELAHRMIVSERTPSHVLHEERGGERLLQRDAGMAEEHNVVAVGEIERRGGVGRVGVGVVPPRRADGLSGDDDAGDREGRGERGERLPVPLDRAQRATRVAGRRGCRARAGPSSSSRTSRRRARASSRSARSR